MVRSEGLCQKCSVQPIINRALGFVPLTLFRIRGGWGKKDPYQFFYCNFYKRRNQPAKLSEFSFHAFATLVLNFKFAPSASPKLLNLNQNHPSNPYKIEVMTTFLIEMLELPNFGHMTKSTI